MSVNQEMLRVGLPEAAKTLPGPAVLATMWSGGQQPECGKLLAQFRASRGWTQEILARKLGQKDRNTVATWETGDHWPRGDSLQRLIAITVGGELVADAQIAAAELETLMQQLSEAGKDAVEIADTLCTYAYPKVLASLILKAQGAGADSKCIALFFSHRKEVQAELVQAQRGKAKKIGNAQGEWLKGDGVYEAGESASAEGADAVEPEPGEPGAPE